jgi:hypothetical protein
LPGYNTVGAVEEIYAHTQPGNRILTKKQTPSFDPASDAGEKSGTCWASAVALDERAPSNTINALQV